MAHLSLLRFWLLDRVIRSPGISIYELWRILEQLPSDLAQILGHTHNSNTFYQHIFWLTQNGFITKSPPKNLSATPYGITAHTGIAAALQMSPQLSPGAPARQSDFAPNPRPTHVHLSDPSAHSILSEKDAIGVFRQEFNTSLKALKWKISAEKLEDVLKFLYRYWVQLDWTAHPPNTFPADSLKKILRYLTPIPEEDVGEQEKTELEACLQTCWDEFAP
jgi:hypothetical protein